MDRLAKHKSQTTQAFLKVTYIKAVDVQSLCLLEITDSQQTKFVKKLVFLVKKKFFFGVPK